MKIFYGFLMLFLLTSCSNMPGMPGMVAKFDNPKYAKSVANDQNVSEIPFTVQMITPKLVQDIGLSIRQRELIPQGTGPFKNPIDLKYTYKLGSQDSLRISVWGHPDLMPTLMAANPGVTSINAIPLSTGRTIDAEGNVYFPLAGTIHAAGLTVSQFREQLAKRLVKYIFDPQVEVDVGAFRSQRIFIAGEVKTPGVLPITDQPLRIVDAIELAGGATPNADLSQVILTRGEISATLDLDKMLYQGDQSVNLLLQNGDTLAIPDLQSKKIFVLGDVGSSAQAKSYVMHRGKMSLAEVISDAGGLNQINASASDVYLLRADRSGGPLVYRLNASEPQSLILAEQFPIQPRDVIFVSATTGATISRYISQFMPIAQGANTITNTTSSAKASGL